MSDIWERIADLLEKKLAPGAYQLWVKPLRGKLENGALVLHAPNEFVRNHVQLRLQEEIMEAAGEVLSCTPRISFLCEHGPAPVLALADNTVQTRTVSRQMSLPVAHALPTQSVQSWRHQFNDFVVGPCNSLAYAASRGFCQELPGSDQLFLCSAPGLGKTHLTQAIGAEIARQSNRRHLRICYLSGEEFASQLVMSIKSRTVDQFKERFRSGVDLLMLEDVHFFQGKEKMQDELLNILKSLQNKGRRVVMTSTFLPKELSDIDPGLLSRFAQGFLAVMDKPDSATRLNIIQAKSRVAQVHIPNDVAALLADRIRSDIRQLESCLKNIILKARLLNTDISMDLAWEILQNYDLDSPSIDLERVISFVCQAYGFGLEELRSKSRKRDRVMARNTAFYLARKHTELSLADIGRRFNRKHSTVIKGIAAVEQEVARKTALGNQLSHTISQMQV